jgi:SAM-dependent methyltransferase
MTPPPADDRFDAWMRDLERRHATAFEFRELTRALRALSAAYVERRERLVRAGALDSAGKRAAFALYYAPLHFMLVAEVVRALGATERPVRSVVDLGCGAGAAGAAWAASMNPPACVIGVDRHPWVLDEASRTYRAFGLRSRLVKHHASDVRLPAPGSGIVAAFVANELPDEARDRLLLQLMAAADRGVAVLVVEPIARSVTPWWEAWRRTFAERDGRADDWRLPVNLPPLVAKLDRAAGLSHDALTARTLWVPARNQARSPRNR